MPLAGIAGARLFEGRNMHTGIRRIAAITGEIAASAAIGLAIPQSAAAQPTLTTAACGYDGYDGSNGEQPLYTHCGKGFVQIEVDHFFWQKTYFCARPGTQEIPQGTSQWRIIGAEYDGRGC
jgi:hypothetical protein